MNIDLEGKNLPLTIMPEPWDTSRAKASELRLEQWGTPEEVAMMAAPIRKADSRREAETILRDIIRHSPFTSRSGLTARIPSRSIGKIVSSEAVNASFCQAAHYQAAVNMDKFFLNAIEPWFFELNPHKVNTGLKARRYLYAPMKYGRKIVVVKITVKEYLDAELQNNIYSIEALDVDLGA
jgi:hypothetical protein